MDDCPSFVGPVVMHQTWFEFYCDVKSNETDQRARFNVSFLFDYEPDADVPFQIVNVSNLRATLHERHLAGKLNKTVRLQRISTNILITHYSLIRK